MLHLWQPRSSLMVGPQDFHRASHRTEAVSHRCQPVKLFVEHRTCWIVDEHFRLYRQPSCSSIHVHGATTNTSSDLLRPQCSLAWMGTVVARLYPVASTSMCSTVGCGRVEDTSRVDLSQIGHKGI